MRDQKITAADGSEFTVEREDGDPQVGDTAYPDGTYTMEDGTVIVIEDNLITSITNPEEEGEGNENKGTAGDGGAAPTDEDDKDQQIADLQKQVSDHETRIGELETTVSELTAELKPVAPNGSIRCSICAPLSTRVTVSSSTTTRQTPLPKVKRRPKRLFAKQKSVTQIPKSKISNTLQND